MRRELEELQQRILTDIALARHIDVGVESYTGNELVLAAPLAENSNHKGTAFGGSLFSLAVLSGWGLLVLKLAERGVEADIVIQDSRMMYRRPVTGDFRARATLPPLEEFDRLLHMLERRGRGRLELGASIEQDGVVAVDFLGTFAVVA